MKFVGRPCAAGWLLWVLALCARPAAAWKPAQSITRRLALLRFSDVNAPVDDVNALPAWSGKDGDPALIDLALVPEGFKSGFVCIMGSPNVGKSTLMNLLVGDSLSIATSKAQTTRHQILGIVTTEHAQVCFTDTPGIIDPQYRLQEGMMQHVRSAVSGADVVLLVTDMFQEKETLLQLPQDFVATLDDDRPIVVAVNKIDLVGKTKVEVDPIEVVEARWKAQLPNAEVVPISALEHTNADVLLETLFRHLPEAPPAYPADTLTDKPERFFVSEIIRKQLFLQFSKEVPYSCEVRVDKFKDRRPNLKIEATILVNRDSQKGIVIGKGGAAIKEVRLAAKKQLKAFFNRAVTLELQVKVEKDWRSRDPVLRAFGYLEDP